MTLAPAVLRYLEAFDHRPTRAESLVRLARYCRNHGHCHVAYLFARAAITIPQPPDLLFVEPAAYEWEALDELSIAEYWTGRYAESHAHCQELLDGGRLPESQRERVTANLGFAAEKLPVEDEQPWWVGMGRG